MLLDKTQLLFLFQVRMIIIKWEGQFLVVVTFEISRWLDSVLILICNDIPDQDYCRILLSGIFFSLRLHNSSLQTYRFRLQFDLHSGNITRIEDNVSGLIADSIDYKHILTWIVIEIELSGIVGHTSDRGLLDIDSDILHRLVCHGINDSTSDRTGLGTSKVAHKNKNKCKYKFFHLSG